MGFIWSRVGSLWRYRARRQALFCASLLWSVGGLTGCQSRAAEGRVTFVPANTDGATAAALSPVVPLEVSGRLEAVTAEVGTSVSDFRTRVSLAGIRTLPLVGMGRPGALAQAESYPLQLPKSLATLAPGESLLIDVTPESFNEDSVTLAFQLYTLEEGTGKRKLISEPRIIAPYDELSEIQQVDTSPRATISRLSLSVLPTRPRSDSDDRDPSKDASRQAVSP